MLNVFESLKKKLIIDSFDLELVYSLVKPYVISLHLGFRLNPPCPKWHPKPWWSSDYVGH